MDRILKRYACIGCGEEFVSVDWGGIHLELLEEPDYKVYGSIVLPSAEKINSAHIIDEAIEHLHKWGNNKRQINESINKRIEEIRVRSEIQEELSQI
jgi:hypothetical protein